jgi:hypothetical protein
MDKHCEGCTSKSKSIHENDDWSFCMNRNTYEDAHNYHLKHGTGLRYDANNLNLVPSCMLVQSACDGKCPWKTYLE